MMSAEQTAGRLHPRRHDCTDQSPAACSAHGIPYPLPAYIQVSHLYWQGTCAALSSMPASCSILYSACAIHVSNAHEGSVASPVYLSPGQVEGSAAHEAVRPDEGFQADFRVLRFAAIMLSEEVRMQARQPQAFPPDRQRQRRILQALQLLCAAQAHSLNRHHYRPAAPAARQH